METIITLLAFHKFPYMTNPKGKGGPSMNCSLCGTEIESIDEAIDLIILS